MAVDVRFEYHPDKIENPYCLVGIFKEVNIDDASLDLSSTALIGGDGYLSHNELMYASGMNALAIDARPLGHERFQVFGNLAATKLALSIELSGCTLGPGNERLCTRSSLIAIELATLLGKQMELIFDELSIPANQYPREYAFAPLGCKTLRSMTHNGTAFPYRPE